MNRLSFIFGLVCMFVFGTGCMKTVINGEQKVSTTARQWLNVYTSGDVLTFKTTKGKTLVFTLGDRKNVFNAVTDCNKSGLKEICDSYQMESVFYTATSSDGLNALSISVSRGVEKGMFFDGLDVIVNIADKGKNIKAAKIVYNELATTPSEVVEAAYNTSIVLGDASFKDVYSQKTATSEIYFTQNEGVIAFKYQGEDIWVKQ